MKRTITSKKSFTCVGISIATSYQNELSTDKCKIPSCVEYYFSKKLSSKITNRTNPNTTICAYTDYSDNHLGEYTYFIGEEVQYVEDHLPEGMSTLTIPAQDYVKFTTKKAPMPKVVIEAWQQIWNLTKEELGGSRLYHTDFEIYDHRSIDPQNTILDIYIGIR